jgi:hypothetical protein
VNIFIGGNEGRKEGRKARRSLVKKVRAGWLASIGFWVFL